MISPDRQRIKNGPRDTFGTSAATRPFRLSATMVELSLRHKQPDSGTDVPAKPPIKSDCYSAEATGQLISGIMASTTEEKGSKASQFHHSELVHAGRELLRTFISRVSHQRVKTFAWLRTRTGIVALALLAFPALYAFHHRPDSAESQSQIPAMPQQPERPRVPSTASRNTSNHTQTVAPQKTKSRRRQSDYIAKDTYTYYGKDGKPNH
jgi:hypothetical protein